MPKLIAWLKGRPWARIAANTGLFVALFLVFLYLTFPYNVIGDLLAQKIESVSGFTVSIADVRAFRLFGVKVEGLKVGSAGETQKSYFDIDEARLRVRPSQLLLGRLWLDFDVYAYGGGVAGSLCRHGGVTDAALNFVELKVSRYNVRELAKKYGQLDMDGVISGDFNFHYAKGARRGNSGGLNMTFDRLRAANVVILGKPLPNLTFEPSKLSMELQNKVFKLSEFDLKGNHVELKANGQIYMNDETPRKSRANFTLKFKPSDEFDEALGVLVMGLGAPDAEGFYDFRMNGPLDNISARK